MNGENTLARTLARAPDSENTRHEGMLSSETRAQVFCLLFLSLGKIKDDS